MKLLLTCLPGLDDLWIDEMSTILGREFLPEKKGHCHLDLSEEELAKTLNKSRLTSRVYQHLSNFFAWDEESFEALAGDIDWSQYMYLEDTFAVFSSGSLEGCSYGMNFANLMLKDVLCDFFTKNCRERPSVDRQNPDKRYFIRFEDGRVDIYLDLLSMPLHRRGYRQEGGEAALKEARAYALYAYAQKHGEIRDKIYDPFCGSGTILIEAALAQQKWDPGLFHSWYQESLNHLPELKKILREQELEVELNVSLSIAGSDRDTRQLDCAQKNISSAKKSLRNLKVPVKEKDFFDCRFENMTILSNPPHGVRLQKESIGNFFSRVAAHLKQNAKNSNFSLFLPEGGEKYFESFQNLKKKHVKNATQKNIFLYFEIE